MACPGDVPVDLKQAVKSAEDAGLERARKRAQTVLSLTERATESGEAPTLRDTRAEKKKKEKNHTKASAAPPSR
jgi:hypothetical protein